MRGNVSIEWNSIVFVSQVILLPTLVCSCRTDARPRCAESDRLRAKSGWRLQTFGQVAVRKGPQTVRRSCQTALSEGHRGQGDRAGHACRHDHGRHWLTFCPLSTCFARRALRRGQGIDCHDPTPGAFSIDASQRATVAFAGSRGSLGPFNRRYNRLG